MKSTVLSAAAVHFLVEKSVAKVGGGALPLTELPSYAVAIEPLQISAAELDRRFRKLEIPVIGRIHEDRLLLDMRTFSEDAVKDLVRISGELEIFQSVEGM